MPLQIFISAELTFKDYVDFEENVIYLTEEVPDYIAKFLGDIKPDYVIIIHEMFNPIFPYCGAKLHKHEIKKWKINKQTIVYKQRYKCTDHACSKTITTPLSKIVEKNCCYTKEIRKKGNEIEYLEHTSYEKKSELIENQYGIKIPRQTVQYHEFTKSKQYLSQKE